MCEKNFWSVRAQCSADLLALLTGTWRTVGGPGNPREYPMYNGTVLSWLAPRPKLPCSGVGGVAPFQLRHAVCARRRRCFVLSAHRHVYTHYRVSCVVTDLKDLEGVVHEPFPCVAGRVDSCHDLVRPDFPGLSLINLRCAHDICDVFTLKLSMWQCAEHGESRLSDLFAYLLFFVSSHSFSSPIFSLLGVSLSLPTSAFPSVHIVRSLTSKLPSITI